MKKIRMLPITLLSFLFGNIKWSAPPWLRAANKFRQNRAFIFYGIFIALILAVGAFQYYQSLPQPITVKAELRPIGSTPNRENAKPDSLKIQFVYDLSRLKKDQKHPEGYPSMARIDLIGKNLNEGISLTPEKEGTWMWTNDKQLSFVPKSDWPAGTEYKVEFESSIFVKEARMSALKYQFKTPDFSASIDSLEFYQDPQNISIRRVISTIKFSHPVDKKSLENKLKMSMQPSDSKRDTESESYDFEITYDKNLREAYIQSQPIALPNKPNYMKLFLDDGVKTVFGGSSSSKSIDEKILIPDIYSFLKIKHVETRIVRNEKNIPEQVLTLEFTDYIEKKEVLRKLQLYLLPEKGEVNGKDHWRSPREVSQEILADRTKLDLSLISNEKSYSKFYSFVIDVQENRALYIKIDAGLTSVNDFIHTSFYDTISLSPSYPKEVSIAGQGSLLTYSGDQKMSIQSRGLHALKYSIGRLIEGQLYHLITQTRGDINNPDFSSWTFQPENIAEFEHEVIDIFNLHPKLSNYSSLDLSRFLPQENNRLGLFFIKAQGWDRINNQPIYGVEDTRLVLVTDLGIIVKNNGDKTQDIFVQSINTGKPVAGATVELLGKNGIALYSKVTSDRGHVDFPSTRNFRNEKEPAVYVVKTKQDISFIPFDRYSRQINLSKFDIGGVHIIDGGEPLNAFLFSDRGIYRPGEEVNIGVITKNFDFSNIEDIPLELVVHGPRNNEVKVKKLNLAELGFFDFQYQTEPTSDTGRYSVSLHLIGNNRNRGREIGSVEFKVEEFQPDTMKIESQLSDIAKTGWTNKKNIQIQVSLQNLFGLPAQNRDVTGRVIIKPTHFSFKKYKNYQFSSPFLDQTKKAMTLDRKLKTIKTDADGLAVFNIDLEQFSQGAYSLYFMAEGFEPGGGRSVLSSNRALISPLSELVGFKADGKLDYIHENSKRNIKFIAIGKTLKQLQKSDLIFKLFRIQHISTLVKQHNGTYKYQSVKKESELSTEMFNIPEGGYSYNIDTSEPGDFAIEMMDNQGRRLSRVEYSIVGHSNLTGKLDKNSELQLKLNKTDYIPGEVIEMNIKAPYVGAGLITIENDKVRQFKWFKTDSQSSIQRIKIPPELEGTAYVNVSYVRNVTSKEIFSSPLSYAVKPFSIDKSKRKIDLVLEVDDLVRPGKSMPIKYSTSKNSKVVIFAIDEGILRAANYSSPNPLNHFLKKRALTVETSQILDLILPEFELLRSVSGSGGDISVSKLLAKNINPFSRKTDRPAIFWSGILSAGKQSQTVNFDVPNTFAGSLRIMAVAVAESSVGAAQQSTVVRGPFVISPHVLNQVAPGDEFIVTVGVTNVVEGSGKDAELDIEVTASKHLTLLEKSSIRMKISEGDEEQFSFWVKANQKLGSAELEFSVQYKNEESKRTAGLSVRPAMPFSSSFESGFDKNGDVKIDLNRKLYSNLAVQTASASSNPLVLVAGLTSYLKNFPHGCTEQIVSRVFPLVGLMNHPLYAPHVKNIDQQFSYLIDKLRERQLSSGGFSFWPGQNKVAEYPSIYVMHFLIEASSLGYPVPTDMLERGKYYLMGYVEEQSDTLVQARIRANAIYLLTRLGVVTSNYLIDLEEQLEKNAQENKKTKPWQEDLLVAYMAATYQLMQQDTRAEKLIDGYKIGQLNSVNSNDKIVLEHDGFHSALAQDAQFIYLISKHFKRRAKALSGESLINLTSKIFKGEYNTISSAYSILALGAYSQLALKESQDENITFSSWVEKKDKKILQAVLNPFPSANYPVDSDSLLINGEQAIYFLNTQSGFDVELPEEAIRKGIEIQRDFIDEKGNVVTTFEQGQEITVRLRVRALNNRLLSNIAVMDLLPGGFEVIRSSISRTAYNWKADYVDVREDRVIYYGEFDKNIRELTYKVKLTAAGKFVIPPSYAESMYDRSIRGVSTAGRFVVTKQSID